MEWDDVRVVLALLETRNLHDAGKRLNVDRSTVSRRLSVLERTLGTRLFVRTRDGVRPTAAAERMRPFAEKMAVDAASARQAVQGSGRAAGGLVRIATTEAVAALLVDLGLLALREQHPDMLIELLTSNTPVDLLRGDADIAVRISPLRNAALRVRCIARLEVGLFAAPSYLERRGRPKTAAALHGHDVILPAGDLAQLPEARWLARRSGVRIAFRSNSVPALRSAAALGHGVVPLTALWGDLDRRLERVRVLDEVPERALWLVTPPAAGTRAEVRVVADRIATLFARY